jgi:signal transduction histidine kinase/DNA-binding LytR/AlgR family response regulator
MTRQPAAVDELRQQLAERSQQLDDTQVELQQTNSELLMLTGELDSRIDQLTGANTQLESYQLLIEKQTAQLIEATDAANAANRAKSAFLANMSHELRTPMSAILGFANLLGDDELSGDRRHEYLDIIARSGRHLLALITELLDTSKIESGRMEVKSSPMRLHLLANDTVELLRDTASHTGLDLSLEIADDVPRVVLADENKLREVMLNLLGNAITATTVGSVGLSLRMLTDGSTSGTTLSVEVSDTGVGIAPDDLEVIFEPFRQAGQATGGTGLGLSISRRFVELMGGTLTVESVVGRGSVFHLVLPVQASDDASVAVQGATRPVDGLEPGQTVRVMVVEDQPVNALLLHTLMERAGIDSTIACNGAEAVELFATLHPQLIWMDRRMPVMDGVEATRHIRALPGGDNVIIVGVTASALSDERAALVDAGMDMVISKPYEPSEIFGCLEQTLHVRFRYHDESPDVGSVDPVLDAAGLARLPAAVLDELQDALTLLDQERIESAVRDAQTADAAIGSALRTLATSLQYGHILSILDECDTHD